MSNYWIVDATIENGQSDQADMFIRRGYWHLGLRDESRPLQAKLRDKIKPGDGIAIKKMLGQGSPYSVIRALGVVKEVDKQDKKIYINWLELKKGKEIPSGIAGKSINGPFTENSSVVNEVFYI